MQHAVEFGAQYMQLVLSWHDTIVVYYRAVANELRTIAGTCQCCHAPFYNNFICNVSVQIFGGDYVRTWSRSGVEYSTTLPE